jgi:methenyltetrahydrofolate cyclohydrolase
VNGRHEPIAQRSVAAIAEDIARGEPGHGGGVGAALTTALAAALVTLVARASSDTWAEADGIAAQATALRARAAELADADAAAFASASAGLRQDPDLMGRPPLGPLLEQAADVPLRIAMAAADVAELAVLAARRGAPDRRADAVAAAALAEGAARTAAVLVDVNLATTPDDARAGQAQQAVDAATAAREAASALVD